MGLGRDVRVIKRHFIVQPPRRRDGSVDEMFQSSSQSRELHQNAAKPITPAGRKTNRNLYIVTKPFYLILRNLGHPLRHAVVTLSVYVLLAGGRRRDWVSTHKS